MAHIPALRATGPAGSSSGGWRLPRSQRRTRAAGSAPCLSSVVGRSREHLLDLGTHGRQGGDGLLARQFPALGGFGLDHVLDHALVPLALAHIEGDRLAGPAFQSVQHDLDGVEVAPFGLGEELVYDPAQAGLTVASTLDLSGRHLAQELGGHLAGTARGVAHLAQLDGAQVGTAVWVRAAPLILLTHRMNLPITACPRTSSALTLPAVAAEILKRRASS